MAHGSIPAYVELYESGELARRVYALKQLLAPCVLCPRRCKADRRSTRVGACASGEKAALCSAFAHRGEEPVLTGTHGSGCLFFANCNLRCAFCQNWQISQQPQLHLQDELDDEQLAQKMLWLQEQGCHNINLVSPTHFVPQICAALLKAIPQGLRLPIVYNSNGYDSFEVIGLLEGIVDIYLPDLKYSDDAAALEYSGIASYWEHARQAVAEMYRQVGELELDEHGCARRGLIIRHLILPNDLAGTEEVLCWIGRELSPRVAVSLMSQYYPTNKSDQFPLLSRKIRLGEYASAVGWLEKYGLSNGWVQEYEEAPDYYQPDFERDKPFEE